jgi:hypothetical protein
MPIVVAAVVRCGRTFSGGATTSVVGDVGGGGGRHDGLPRPFGCHVIMIACVCALPSWCSRTRPSVADAAACSYARSARFGEHGSLGSINPRGGKG